MTQSNQIAIIGGGFGGICAGVQIQKQLGLDGNGPSFTIFDENEEFGGVWLKNTYPGCACEIPSHVYSFSFEPNPNWSQSFASQPEILAYLLKIAKKYQLYKRARLNTKVQSVQWLDEEQMWQLNVLDKMSGKKERLQFKYVILAVGGLRLPLIPSEFQKFTGVTMHSAEWDSSVDLSGKRVGVIGSGASALQIVPSIASKVKELHSYQRSPTWILPRAQFDIPQLVQKLFTAFPIFMYLFRALIFLRRELDFGISQMNSIFHYIAAFRFKFHLRRQVKGNENLVRDLHPDYTLGCKRVLGSSDFFRTFLRSNVYLHRGEIEKIEGNRIKMKNSNTPQELDVLILATGFRVQDFYAPMTLTGPKNLDVAAKWMEEGVKHFYGIARSVLPNFFSLTGANSAVSHNSIIFIMECQVDFMIKLIRQTEEKGAKTVTVKRSSENRLVAKISKDLKTNVGENERCGGWFHDANGVNNVLWPKTSISYWLETKNINKDDFEWTF